MLVRIPEVLDQNELKALRDKLESAGPAWVDGRVTAGYQGAPVKFNQQIDERSEVARQCQQIVLAAVEGHSTFISAALPNAVYPPMFNRYGEGMTFGDHIDGSIRILPDGRKLRTDLSATLFLSEPDEYDGGELEIHDTYGLHRAKFAAGDMVLYPATSLHRVTPITRGIRVACFFWTQSLVRDDTQRALLFDLDNAIQKLNATGADEVARRTLIGVYHNLIRQWSAT
ncbi:Fe2+-dependent dioxygenase [Herbaspirillum chlorophenolicum]|jgi:PKHD-type hydroxylase|uniref:Fe2+-dependent dioxygenase n=1 Tax=Herbaspirillum chlorophenolicum TaxID=211589 RepID=A0ABW8F1T4_9BURK